LKKIAVITTGGTIGSVLTDKSVAVDTSLEHLAEQIELSRLQLDCQIQLYSPFSKSSENLGPGDWQDLLVALKQANDSDCDAIVVTHGTDTMEYSAAAVLCCGQLWTKKICFTGAYYPPGSENSDVAINLQGALAWACGDLPKRGVAVSFKSAEQQYSEILNAFGLKSMLYDERTFTSSGKSFARYDKSGISHVQSDYQQTSPQLPLSAVPRRVDIDAAANRIAFVHLYPGIDQKLLRSVATDRDVLVLQGYHCGTGPADEDSGLLDFVSAYSESTSILMAGYPEELVQLPYDSSIELISAGLRLYKNMPAYYVYVYALIGLAIGLNSASLVETLSDYEVRV